MDLRALWFSNVNLRRVGLRTWWQDGNPLQLEITGRFLESWIPKSLWFQYVSILSHGRSWLASFGVPPIFGKLYITWNQVVFPRQSEYIFWQALWHMTNKNIPNAPDLMFDWGIQARRPSHQKTTKECQLGHAAHGHLGKTTFPERVDKKGDVSL